MTYARNNSKFFIIRCILLFPIFAFVLSCTAFSQTPGSQEAPATPTQNEEPDLINPDRPGIADGSSVVGSKTFQIESGIQLEYRRSGDSREHTFFVPTLLRFGIGNRWEARIEGNSYTRDTTFASGIKTDQASGFAPTSLGFKYHIYNSSGDHQVSLGTIVRVFPTWGANEFRTQHTTGDIRLAADWN